MGAKLRKNALTSDMITNYLRSAWRGIRRNKLYSLISIGCLSIGIAVCMTILLYVLHEHSYERWQANSHRIFAVSGTFKWGDATFNSERLSFATAPLAAKADAGVEGWLRGYPAYGPVNLVDPSKPSVSYTEKGNFLYADSNYYSFFSFRLLRGQASAVLARPNTLVLTERAAKKYFGVADPVGRTLLVNGLYTFEVTGVQADPPSNTDIRYDFVASLASLASMKEMAPSLVSQQVQGGSFKTWLLLKDPAAAGRVGQTLARLSVVKGQPDDAKDIYNLSALADGHLGLNFGDFSNLIYLRIFPLVAGLILLLALINYMSLATARASARAKEVGVRKVLGAGRSRLAGQFYTESAVFALLSFLAGTLLFLLWRPYFFQLLHLTIDSSFLLSPVVLAWAGGLFVLVILLAGSYPSLVLSAFKPVAVLYGKLSRRRGGERVRKGFIVFQFTVSLSLVICSLVIKKELYFIRHTDTGVDRDNVVMVPFNSHFGHYAAFKREVEALPGIREASTSLYGLYKGLNAWSVKPPGGGKEQMLMAMSVDDHFIPMLGLRWVRKPSQEGELLDGKHILLNETAVAALNLSGDAVGQRLKLGNEEVTVAGVLKDFNYDQLKTKIGPLCVSVSGDTASGWGKELSGCMLAKIQAHANVPTVVESIRKIYSRYDHQTAFEYSFADDAFDAQYKAEDRLAGLFGVFTGITIVIACLGLFALATFSAQQRLKEIGIRKVLGASVGSIGALLSRDFLRPVLLAVVIACPVSWWLMNKWLDDFAYRTELSWWVFAVSGLGLLLVALGTVLSRSWRAGRANPVENLRSE
jgi:putative ABC transport system permease protein